MTLTLWPVWRKAYRYCGIIIPQISLFKCFHDIPSYEKHYRIQMEFWPWQMMTLTMWIWPFESKNKSFKDLTDYILSKYDHCQSNILDPFFRDNYDCQRSYVNVSLLFKLKIKHTDKHDLDLFNSKYTLISKT